MTDQTPDEPKDQIPDQARDQTAGDNAETTAEPVAGQPDDRGPDAPGAAADDADTDAATDALPDAQDAEDRADASLARGEDKRGDTDADADDTPGAPQRPAERVPSAGERIAKMMARAGVASRREAERMIVEGRVTVNGEKITSPALDVLPVDRIKVDGKPMEAPQETRLWLYYKPLGLVTSESDEKGRQTVFDALPRDLPRVMSVGRLDLNSEGLLLLTNDGELKRRLELPATGWLRRYRVRVNGNPSELTFDPLRRGAVIDGEEFQPMEIRLDSQKGANAWLTVGIREGRNREIRRAMAHVGLQVNRLIRVGYGPFRLEGLDENEVREVKRRVLRDQLGGLLTGEPEDQPRSRGPRSGPAEDRAGRPARPARGDRPASQDRPAWGDRPGRTDADRGQADRDGPRKPRSPRDGSAERGESRPARAEGGFERKPRHGSAGGSYGKPRPAGGQGAPARGAWGERDRGERTPSERSGGERDRGDRRRTDGDTRTPRGPGGEGGARGPGRWPREAQGAPGGPRSDRGRDTEERDRKPRTAGKGGYGDRPRSGAGKPPQDGRPDARPDRERGYPRRSETRAEGDAPRAPRPPRSPGGAAGKPRSFGKGEGGPREGGRSEGGRGEGGRGQGSRVQGNWDRSGKPGSAAGSRHAPGTRTDRKPGGQSSGQPRGKPVGQPGGQPGGYRGGSAGPRTGGKPPGAGRPGGAGPRGPRTGEGPGTPRGPGGGGKGR